jgi:hypothetical protein
MLATVVNRRQEQEAAEAWRAAGQLAELVARGGRPPAIAPTILLRPDEVQHGSLYLDCQTYSSADVRHTSEYPLNPTLLGAATSALRNARNRSRARQLAKAQWRGLGHVATVITNQRLLLLIDNQWSTFDLSLLVGMQPDARRWTVLLTFEATPPLLLRGPWAPWLVVVISACRYGTPWPPGTPPPQTSVQPGWEGT